MATEAQSLRESWGRRFRVTHLWRETGKTLEKGVSQMTTELELAQMLDQFVDDLNNGVTPRIYELMASGFGAADDLIPLLDLAAQFKASTVQMPANEKERVKAQVLEVAQAKPAVQI